MIQNIDINKIHPHPDNPRKELGDLTEIANSIRENGIFQNLTVVPWFSVGNRRDICGDEGMEDQFTAVIGHRRLEAAKLAGLTEAPCSISDMDYKTQIATMLLENMQRSDLTPIEQAQGFQMMIDLGETISNISEKTGFSDATIRKRLNLVKLDQKKLKESYLRGGTLSDYIELEKIKDIKLRNKVLEHIGTSNFNWQLKNAIDEEERPLRKADLIKELQEFAKPIKDNNGLSYVAGFYEFKNPGYWKKPGKNDKSEYFYKLEKNNITLYKKEEKLAKKELSAEEQSFNKRLSELKKFSKIAYEMRYSFIKEFAASKKYAKEIQYFTLQRLLGYGSFDIDKIHAILNIEKPCEENKDWRALEQLKRNLVIENYKKSPEHVMLAITYIGLNDGSSNIYYHVQNWGDFKIEHSKNDNLDLIYDLLIKLGYEMSDEEKALHDGTHDLFKD